jgi:AraC-like DNA-binding protein
MTPKTVQSSTSFGDRQPSKSRRSPGASRSHSGDDADVLASLLDVHRLTTVIAGRIDLAAPWRLESPPTDLFALVVQISGTSWVASEKSVDPIVMHSGDILIFPTGAAGYMHDGSDPTVPTWTLALPPSTPPSPAPLRLGGDGPHSSMVCCFLRMGDAPRGALLDGLPPILYFSTRDEVAPGGLWRTAELIIAESSMPGAGRTTVMSRLAEILLIQALRLQASADGTGDSGFRALSDPRVAPAIRLIHADPGQPWTVGKLATACGLSRSAFAARFTHLVGQSPLNYLIDWRMATAAKLLRTTDDTVDRVAAEVGYHSEASFRRTFKAWSGHSPREYRGKGQQ